ncbi:MAG: Sensory rhodopsin II transducer [Methanomassiliicoccales archaeon PtaU1.Bin124]|nr:MAG: Sensory rhodopsin II transducer [Methanomassiliicoccales archaeon PtaU1.Bin124]
MTNEKKLDCEGIFESMPTAAFVMDREWRITHFNAAAEKLTGTPKSEAIGMKARDIFGSIGRKGDAVTAALAGGEEVELADFKFVDADDHDVVCGLKARPMKDEKGWNGGTVFLQSDNSQCGRMDQLMAAVHTPIMAVDTDFNITYMSPSGLKMLGKGEADVVGKKCHSFFNTPACNTEHCLIKKCFGDGKAHDGDTVAHLPNGEVPIRVHAQTIKDAEGKVIGAVEQIFDITTEVEITKEARRLVEAGKAGQVKERIKADRFDKNYKAIVTSMNEMLDTYQAPLLVVNAYMKKLAAGEMPNKITADYKGDFSKLKDHINECIDAINLLVTDASMLVEASANGDFTKRADVTRHKGDYAKIVSGVDATLDTVTKQIFWYEQILDSIPFPISVTDMNMNMTFLNKASENIVKKSRAEMKGKHCSNWNGRICNTEDCGIARLRNGNHKTFSDRGGKVTQVNCAYLKDTNGENVGHIEVLQDVSGAMKPAQYNKIEVERLANNLKNIARGDLTIDNNITAPDQYTQEAYDNFQKIYASLKDLNTAIGNLVMDAGMLVAAAKSEEFDTRADTSRHSGEFANVVKGVNDTLDVVVDKIFWYEQLLDAVPWPLSVTDKDMNWTFINKPVEDMLGVKRKDILGKQCSNWNAAICKTKNCGIARLKEGLKETKFDQAGGHFKVDSAYIRNAKGENIGHIEVVQDVTATERAAAYRTKAFEQLNSNFVLLAEGNTNINQELDDADKYTEDVHAQYVEIYKNLDIVVQSIGKLIADAKMLSDAAVAGELETRADITQHKGKYAEVVQGVNDTLDAVIGPINEAMRVADAYAGGDMTARVEIETKGDFTKFASSLDQIGKSLTNLLTEVNRSVEMVSSTSQELASSAEEMNASTEQVSSAIQQISKGAQNQAAQVEDTAKIMAEMANSVEIVVEKSTSAMSAANKATENASKGRETVQNTVRKMQEIQKVVTESAKVIESLGKRSEEIGQIVDVITNISDQTNLLALNAAIEAARAGEQGRGFAVVAEEVKNLAEDSREAAERIAKMIKEVQSETSKAVESMDRGTKEAAEGMVIVDLAGKAFADIAVVAGQTSNEVTEITKLMTSQKDGTQRAAKSVDGIASIAEETASASEESASSTEELTASMEDMTARAQSLSEMAVNLQKISGQFKISDDAPAHAVAAPTIAKPKAPAKHGKEDNKVPAKVKESLAKRGLAHN